MLTKEYIERSYQQAILEYQSAHNEEERWIYRKTMARLERLASEFHGFAYSDELEKKKEKIINSK